MSLLACVCCSSALRPLLCSDRLLVLESLNPLSGRLVPLVRVTLVDGVNLSSARDANVLVRQDELAERRVEREAVDAETRAQHKNRSGVVQSVAGGN